MDNSVEGRIKQYLDMKSVRHNLGFYIGGGVVRDMLHDIPPRDTDLVITNVNIDASPDLYTTLKEDVCLLLNINRSQVVLKSKEEYANTEFIVFHAPILNCDIIFTPHSIEHWLKSIPLNISKVAYDLKRDLIVSTELGMRYYTEGKVIQKNINCMSGYGSVTFGAAIIGAVESLTNGETEYINKVKNKLCYNGYRTDTIEIMEPGDFYERDQIMYDVTFPEWETVRSRLQTIGSSSASLPLFRSSTHPGT